MAGIIKVNQYQDFNGNTLFTSDGNGNLTTQEIMYPAFSVKPSADQSIANNSFTKLNFQTENFDTNNAFDNVTNYRFTVPTGFDGKYVFHYAVRISSLGDQDVFQIMLYKNGAEQTNSRQISIMGLADNGVTRSNWIDDAVAGDYYEVYTIHNYGSARDTGSAYTNFYGYRIGS